MATAPYETVETALNLARTRLNDAIVSIGGEILTDNAPFTLTVLNGAWRKLQGYLASNGLARLVNEGFVLGLPAVNSPDPLAVVSLSWTSYINNGSVNNALVLPQDLIFPLQLWERVTGPGTLFLEMDEMKDGLPLAAKRSRNVWWQWQTDQIVMPGALNAIDLRVRYAAYLADFIDPAGIGGASQPIPILRALNSLANFIAAEIAEPRGDLDAKSFIAAGQLAAQEITGTKPNA